jgi:hypothetical protein
MRLLNKYIVALSTVGILALAPQAKAGFVPPSPTMIAAFLPGNNVVTVSKIGTSGGLDIYQCSPSGQKLTVLAGTASATVQKSASANWAWSKFLIATVPAAQRTNMLVVQTAQIWFMANIYNPFYR